MLGITGEILKRRKQNVDLVQLRYDAGREHKGSLLTAQAHLAKAEYEATQAKRNIILSQRRLIVELGRDDFSDIAVNGSLSLNIEDKDKVDFMEILDKVPSVKKFKADSRRERLDLKAAKAEFSPAINFDASLGKTSGSWPPKNDYWSMGVTVTFPVFEGGKQVCICSKGKSCAGTG